MPKGLDLAADIALRLVVAREDDLDGVVTEALASLAQLADVERAYVTLLHDDRTFENSHEWTAGHIVPHRPVLQRVPADRFPHSIALAHADRVFAVPDVGALPEDASAERDSFSSFGVRSVLQVPIRVDAQTIGLVGFNGFERTADWTDDLIDAARRVGQAIGVALVRKRAAHDIRVAWEEAERANRAKDDLLASVSHELRTPLHALMGYAELLELDERTDNDRRALLEIQFNGRRLLTLVEELIYMAEHTAGDRAIGDAEVEPIVLGAISMLEPAAASQGVTLRSTDRLGGMVAEVGEARLRQVLYSVLSGALGAVSPGGTVTVDAAPGEQTPAEPAARLVLDMSSTRSVEPARAVTPLARSLMDGLGQITVEPDVSDPTTAHILIDFDQDARP